MVRHKLIRKKNRPAFLYRSCLCLSARIYRLFMSSSFATWGKSVNIYLPERIVGNSRIELGDKVSIWSHARIEALESDRNAESGSLISIGEEVVIQPYVHLAAVEGVCIGPNCLIASRVFITDHDHDILGSTDVDSRNSTLVASKVVIGAGVWLGEGVHVLKGVAIGNNSIVGSGAVVTKSLPAYSIAVGNPARVIRQFNKEAGVWEQV